MKQLFKALLVVTIITSMAACKNDKKKGESKVIKPNAFTITGTTANIDNGTMQLNFEGKDEWTADTVAVVNGHFTFKNELAYPHTALIGIKGEYPSEFFLENTDITLHIDTTKTNPVTVKGSPLYDTYKEFVNQTQTPFNNKLNALYRAYDTVENKNIKDSIENAIDTIDKEIESRINTYITDNPNSYIAANILDGMQEVLPPSEFEKAFNGLSDTMKQSVLGLKMADGLQWI